MTVPSCDRCGQLLLPEIVRELGDGRRCPFCGAELKLDAKVNNKADNKGAASAGRDIKNPALAGRDIKSAAASGRPPPPAPAARMKAPAVAPTLPGMSAGGMQTAAAVAVAPSIPRSNTMPTMAFARVPQPNTASPMAFAPAPRPDAAPAMAFARALEPDAAPNLLSVPSPRPLEPAPVLDHRLAFAPQSTGAGSGWEAVVRGRPWLAALAAGAVIATVVLVAGRRPTATRRESSVLAPTAVRPAPVALRNVSPPSPPPPTGDRDVDERRPARPTTSGSPAATRHANEGAPAHAAQRGHHEKRRAAHPTRGKHQRVVAMQSAAAPKGSEDERSARAAYDRGNQRLLSGDTAAAIAAYEEAVRSAPSSPSGYRGLGLAYEKAGKSAEAIRAFRQYLKLAPSSGDRDLVARRLRHLLRSGGDSGK